MPTIFGPHFLFVHNIIKCEIVKVSLGCPFDDKLLVSDARKLFLSQWAAILHMYKGLVHLFQGAHYRASMRHIWQTQYLTSYSLLRPDFFFIYTTKSQLGDNEGFQILNFNQVMTFDAHLSPFYKKMFVIFIIFVCLKVQFDISYL